MSESSKLIIRISVFALVILILGWLVWAVFFRVPGGPLIPGAEKEGEVGGLPLAGQAGERNLAPEPGFSLLEPEPPTPEIKPDTVAQGGQTETSALTESRAEFSALVGSNFNYYDENSGRFYRLSAGGGEPVLLSDEVFKGVDKVTWDSSGGQAILEFPDGSNIFYDFQTKQRATLPRLAQDFAFSPDGQNLAYEYVGQGEDDRWIVVSQPNGQGQRLVQALGREAHNVQIAWSPDRQVVATYREPTSSLGEEIFFIGLNDENFLSLQTNGLGFRGQWSPQGRQILYSVYSERTDFNPMLHIAGAQGDDIGQANRSLKISTWPEKCVFGDETVLYCAVPQNLPLGSGLYPELAASASDAIYKIDLSSNLGSRLALPSSGNNSSFNITKLMISESGQELYFTDRVSGVLRRLRLR